MLAIDYYRSVFTTTEEGLMLPIWLENTAAAAGLTIGFVAFMRAIYRARHRAATPREAANQQETWADAYDIQREIDSGDLDYGRGTRSHTRP